MFRELNRKARGVRHTRGKRQLKQTLTRRLYGSRRRPRKHASVPRRRLAPFHTGRVFPANPRLCSCRRWIKRTSGDSRRSMNASGPNGPTFSARVPANGAWSKPVKPRLRPWVAGRGRRCNTDLVFTASKHLESHRPSNPLLPAVHPPPRRLSMLRA